MANKQAAIPLDYDVPDFSSMGATSGVKPKKPKTKKVKPKLVIRNHPELTKKMKVGQKHKAQVTITPTMIRNQEGKGEGDLDEGGHRAEFDVHDITPMGLADEGQAGPTAAGAGDVPADFSSLGRKGLPPGPQEEEAEGNETA